MPRPLVSIVSPIYNVRQYLPAFLKSAIEQSYTCWELLAVDDGSTDGSGQLCVEFSRTDSRIQVIFKCNGGVSSARNLGIKMASGDYLYFADPDDEMLPDCLETLVRNMDCGIDLVSASYEFYNNSYLVPKQMVQQCQDRVSISGASYLEGITSVYKPRYFDRYLGSKLFRKSIIDEMSLTFREDVSYREDVVFLFNYVANIAHNKHNIVAINQDVYRYYRRSTGAAMRLTNNYSEHLFDVFFSLADCYDLVSRQEMRRVQKNLTREILRSYLGVNRILIKKGKWRSSRQIRHKMNVFLCKRLRFSDIILEVTRRIIRPFLKFC